MIESPLLDSILQVIEPDWLNVGLLICLSTSNQYVIHLSNFKSAVFKFVAQAQRRGEWRRKEREWERGSGWNITIRLLAVCFSFKISVGVEARHLCLKGEWGETWA